MGKGTIDFLESNGYGSNILSLNEQLNLATPGLWTQLSIIGFKSLEENVAKSSHNDSIETKSEFRHL
ncbi:hypothetical protein BpHYR1_024703 [Brachionus plicatilis]|uniref:Uncharacterized protein n=1 Tax=Brachionus plicatilis TaxID=10195 RepID=A0A3M7SB82_BRAPC|nr:hypothetical protein BpHYR1_024703 [Brachionus plicatilis]